MAYQGGVQRCTCFASGHLSLSLESAETKSLRFETENVADLHQNCERTYFKTVVDISLTFGFVYIYKRLGATFVQDIYREYGGGVISRVGRSR